LFAIQFKTPFYKNLLIKNKKWGKTPLLNRLIYKEFIFIQIYLDK